MKGRRCFLIHGFTLVEILVALTLFSLVLTMIFTGLHSSGRSWQRSEVQIEANDTIRLEMGFVRKQLAQAVPLVLLDGRDNPVLFKGEREAVHFVTNLPSHRGGGGLYLLSLYMTPEDDRNDLALSYRPVSADIDPERLDYNDEVKTIPLMEDIEELEFSYFGSIDQNTEPDWYDDWEAPRGMPELVSMHIEPVQDDLFIPDMIVSLHTGNVRGQPQLTLYKGNQSMDAGTEDGENAEEYINVDRN